MYRRLFTFGCSFTEHVWPTWADIIASDLGIEYQQWGRSSSGNVGIFHAMLECDLTQKFTDKDLILVNWSSWHREDRVNSAGDWYSGGNIFNNPFYNKKFIKNYWSGNNDIVKNSTAIISSNKMFDINYQSHMIDYEHTGEFNELKYDFLNYKFYLDNIPKKNIFDMSCNSQFNRYIDDSHPDVLCHLNHTKTIYKDLNLTLKNSTEEKYIEIQNKVIDSAKSSKINLNKNWDTMVEFFNGLDL